MHTQYDKLIDQFEADLKAGETPEIGEWLEGVSESLRPSALLDFISLEIFYRTKGDQKVRASDYARFGETAVTHAEDVIRQSEAGDRSNFANLQIIPSQRIGRYKLLQKIGEGGMGAVWMAQQEEPVRRRVAMKLIKTELASKEIIARFEAERQALALMDHQNIAKVLDAGTTENGTPYFVMELVKGIAITEYCNQNKLSIEDRLRIFRPVCKAIQHAHQKGILHRDLKPSNVLVTHYDGDAVPKVIDFGMAKATTHNMRLTDKTLFTEFGKVVGTLQYMSPEQAEMNALDVDTRADIYSLGVILYELLTGSTPVDEKTISSNAFFQILKIIREKDPPAPSLRLGTSSVEVGAKIGSERKTSFSKLRQVLKGDLDWVVMKSLEKDRTRRYQTAADFDRDIANYLANETVIARPPTTWYQVQKFASRNRGFVASAAAVGLALLIGVVGTSYGLVRANGKAAEADGYRRNAETQTAEAEDAKEQAKASEALAIIEKKNAQRNEKRAIAAEQLASAESKRARDSEAAAKFQLANARFDANRASDARRLLNEIPHEYRDTFEWRYCARRFLGSDMTCHGHDGKVYKVAYSPDGKIFASASGDKTIKLWDATTGREVRTLRGHKGSVGSIAFSPDGLRLASASQDKTVKLWSVGSGQEIGELTGHTQLVASVVFSPDGELLATASDDRTIRLWDAQTFDNTKTLKGHAAEVGNVVFSPDGKRLVSSSVDRTVRLWDVDSAIEISTLEGHTSFVISVALSPDGRHLASASFDTIKIWDVNAGVEIRSLQGHTQFVHHVAFSPDGTRLASAGRDKSIKLWDVESGFEISTLTGHSDWVNGVAFSPSGQRLGSASYDGTVKVWDTRSGQHIKTIRQNARCRDLTFSPNGQTLAVACGDQSVRVWDAASGDFAFTFDDNPGEGHAVAFAPDGKMLATGGSKKEIWLWDAISGKRVDTLTGHVGAVESLVFSPDGKLLASGGGDKLIKLWNTQKREVAKTLEGHRAPINQIAFSSSSKIVASASKDQTVILWDANSGEKKRLLKGHFQEVNSVAFSPGGDLLATASNDRSVMLWRASDGKPLARLDGHTEAVFCVAFNHDGTRLVSASSDKSIKLWDVEGRREIMTFQGHSQTVKSVAFSPDGASFVSAGIDGEVRFWDASLDANVADENRELEKNEVDYRQAKSRFDAVWHRTRAKAAIVSENWFAATCHFAWLMQNDSDDATNFDGVQFAHDKLREQFRVHGQSLGPFLPVAIQEALKLPRGKRSPKIRLSEAEQINNRTWRRVSSRSVFLKNPMSPLELQACRDAVRQYPKAIFFNTLATAEYRIGNFREAIAASMKSLAPMLEEDAESGSPYPGDYAILAMCHSRLGQHETASQYRVKLNDALKNPAFKDDAECLSFAAEVAEVFAEKTAH